MLPLMALWGTFFYFAMVSEINDATDDSLEEYASLIITRYREGRTLPTLNDGSNHNYTIEPIGREEVDELFEQYFHDGEMYIPERQEVEPARILTTIFIDNYGQPLRLEVAMPTIERDDLYETILFWATTLFGALFVVIIALSLGIARHTLRPLYALLKWLDNYNPGERLSPVPNDTSIREFCRLNQAAQSAVERSERMVVQQREFTSNASHELQTPLAVIGNRVEYLIDHTSPSEEQLAELMKIRTTLRHSVRLNRTLLQLMRIESAQVTEEHDIVVNTLVEESLEQLCDIYTSKSVTCKTTIRHNLRLKMNEALAQALVSNLLKNAFVHSPAGGNIDVEITSAGFTIRNTGTTPLDKARIFERFYTADSAHASTGLGLAIVKSVCELYGYAIEYSYADGYHCFDIRTR